MAIKNYTSEVTVNKSVQHIEDRRVKIGAFNILKEYSESELSGICFIIKTNNKEIPFKLPSKVKNVENYLASKVKKRRSGTLNKIKSQAARTAWKLLSDWVDIQVSLIELDQAEPLEVFLPYAYDYQKKQTFFDRIKLDNFQLLEHKDK